MAQLQASSVNGTITSLRLDNEKTGNHTLELADRDRVVAFTGSSPQTVTIPTDASVNFPIGSVIYLGRYGAGSLTLAAQGGVTVSKIGTFSPNEEMYIRKRASNNWIVIDSPKNLSGTGGAISAADGFTIHSFTSGNNTFTVG